MNRNEVTAPRLLSSQLDTDENGKLNSNTKIMKTIKNYVTTNSPQLLATAVFIAVIVTVMITA